MKIITIVQTRLGSTRLAGKTMLPILGKPLIYRMLERVKAATRVDDLVVATTVASEDDVIAAFCAGEGVECYRGHPTDLLDRHYQVAMLYGADAVSKIPSDCPLIDPGIIDKVYDVFLSANGKYDFVSNLHPPSYPDGNDVEIMTVTALKTAWQEASRGLEREHTTPYFWENAGRFRLFNVLWENGHDYSDSHRWTIDYEEDYQFIKKVYETLYPEKPLFTLEDILELLHKQPEIAEINAMHLGKMWYVGHIDELKSLKKY
jgi:spore coat polysaccharide biosynthesis protein SpsF